MSLDERFQDAAARAKSLPSQSNENLLKLYALFKQGTKGDVSGPEPSAFDFKGKAKYGAWADLKGTSQDDAKEQYIQLIDDLAQG
ncbi:Acyl-CoA-binding protein [Sulfidibacter corallicola]|uniref:Acyl-CoA-binding protein n=1 Tax=Sulfidibacter corallicola TaxID=2818388 RepID=A0A8A4TWF1_SULCO|nr:acyl-CoA-binding protein [Sulfidibacter corallicola]QTD53292.1 acyl-CoA-binding protein [Sulfidibacter corallicola]